MFVLGCDPDLHNTAFAVVENSRCRGLELARIDAKLTQEAAVAAMAWEVCKAVRKLFGRFPDIQRVVVEGQQIYQQGRARPKDLIKLAQVAGAVAGTASEFCQDIRIPLPNTWKGSVPKIVKHKRILNAVGWSYHSNSARVVPKDVDIDVSFPPGKWTHLIDAIGLASWGEKRKR